jgi:hypothetical protein
MSWKMTIGRRCVLDTTLYDKVCHWLGTSLLYSPGPLVSSTNKTDHHDMTEILFENGAKHLNITQKVSQP